MVVLLLAGRRDKESEKIKKKTNKMNKVIKKCILCLISFQMFFIGIEQNCYGNIPPEGNDETEGCDSLDPINTKTGNSHFTEKDLLIKDSLFELMFFRRYNSNNNDYNTPLGRGWTHSYDWRLIQIEQRKFAIDPSEDGSPIIVQVGSDKRIISGTRRNDLEFDIKTGGVPLKYASSAPFFGTLINSPSTELVIDNNPVELKNEVTNIYYEVYMGDGVLHEFHETTNMLGRVFQSDNGSLIIESHASEFFPKNSYYVLHMPGGNRRVFNSFGMMTRIENDWGVDNKNNITLSYSEDRLLEKVESSGGASLDFTYNQNDRLVKVQATPDLYVTYENHGGGSNSTTRHIDGVENGYTYNYMINSLMTNKVSSIGVTNNFYYQGFQDKYGNYRATGVDINGYYYKTEVEYNGDTTYVSYDLRGENQCYIYNISPSSHKTQSIYGPAETFEKARVRGKSNENSIPPFDTTKMTYFDNELGEKYNVFLEYNDSHNVTKVSKSYNDNPAKLSYTMTWDNTYHLPTSQTEIDGTTRTVQYQNGSPHITALNGRATTYNYDDYGRLIFVKDANNHTNYFNRGADGWIESVVSPIGPTLDTTFNSYGYMTELDIIPEGQSNSVGRTYTMDRGSHGRINSTTYPDGLQDHNNFNSWGYLTNRIDRSGRNYDFTYAYPSDLLKSQTQYLESNGNSVAVTTKYDYDEHFNSLRITEPRNRYVETYLFDIQSRIIGVTNIEGQVMSVEYGLQDMVKEINRFDGSKINVGYDKYARQNRMTITSADLTNNTYLAYNLDDTISCVSNSNSSVEYTYRLCNKLTNVVSSAYVQTESSYKYDNVGNPTNTSLAVCSRVAPARDIYSTTSSYIYDAGNRLTGISSWERQNEGNTWQNISYIYNPTNGLASSWTNSASGIFCSYEYDIMNRPISLEWKASDGSTIKSFDYMYSTADMITNVVDNAGNVTKYEYDTLDRLTKETVGDNITAYSYDLAGNRLQMRKCENAQVTNEVDYTLGIGNRLASWGTNGVASYNTAGCLTNMVSNTDNRELNLSWNERYQLTSVSSSGAGGRVSYDYNVLGQRVARSEVVAGVDLPADRQANIEYYIHDGVNIVADLDEDKELLRSYTYAPGYDNIISMTSYSDNETNTYFYIRNHNNSVVALVDENGEVAERYEYSAYGEITVLDSNGNELDESALGNRYTFQGREIDWTTGLYNFRARWYDSETGRWLSKDPIGINGGLNQYVFCGNNPVMFVDPEGNKGSLHEWLFPGSVCNLTDESLTITHDGITEILPPGGYTGMYPDWDRVEIPVGSGNWFKIGPGLIVVKQLDDGRFAIYENPIRRWDRGRRPGTYN